MAEEGVIGNSELLSAKKVAVEEHYIQLLEKRIGQLEAQIARSGTAEDKDILAVTPTTSEAHATAGADEKAEAAVKEGKEKGTKDSSTANGGTSTPLDSEKAGQEACSPQ
ncbi:hypothetical protein AC578_2987 [Pseudocercospora eumusae]|uniref:Uncharacterized protein n=1 Tax=Pseudocercospora eumusae TaxID=321146 RepID=A0A139HE84_9PEZI|nr:hypothetical protein AC578_2987 [Pseudocercospora eumusae]